MISEEDLDRWLDSYLGDPCVESLIVEIRDQKKQIYALELQLVGLEEINNRLRTKISNLEHQLA